MKKNHKLTKITINQSKHNKKTNKLQNLNHNFII
jgi:hypothetical protein